MGLRIKSRSTAITRPIATLMMVFALVAQPMYGLVAMQAASAATAGAEVVYDSLMSTQTGQDYGSFSLRSHGIHELGDRVVLEGTKRKLEAVSFNMSSWSLRTDAGVDGWCNVHAGVCTSDGFSYDMTAKVYTPDLSEEIASVSNRVDIPWRPAGESDCAMTSNGRGWKRDGVCVQNGSGIGFVANFDFSATGKIVPDDAVYTITYNTRTTGSEPTGVVGPIDKVNVSLNGATSSANPGRDQSVAHMYMQRGATPLSEYNWGTDYNLGIRVTATQQPQTPSITSVEAVSGMFLTGSAQRINIEIENPQDVRTGNLQLNKVFADGQRPANSDRRVYTLQKDTDGTWYVIVDTTETGQLSGDGKYLYKVEAHGYNGVAHGYYGNASNWNSPGHHFIVDNTNPSVKVGLSSKLFGKKSTPPTVVVTASDATSEVDYVQYKVMHDGANVSDYGYTSINTEVRNGEPQTASALQNLPSGEYTLLARAFDRAGNKKNTHEVAFTVDNTAPEILDLTVEYNATGTIDVSATVAEDHMKSHWFEITRPDGTVSYVFQRSEGTEAGFTIPANEVTPGEYKVRYVATDRADNRSDGENRADHRVEGVQVPEADIINGSFRVKPNHLIVEFTPQNFVEVQSVVVKIYDINGRPIATQKLQNPELLKGRSEPVSSPFYIPFQVDPFWTGVGTSQWTSATAMPAYAVVTVDDALRGDVRETIDFLNSDEASNTTFEMLLGLLKLIDDDNSVPVEEATQYNTPSTAGVLSPLVEAATPALVSVSNLGVASNVGGASEVITTEDEAETSAGDTSILGAQDDTKNTDNARDISANSDDQQNWWWLVLLVLGVLAAWWLLAAVRRRIGDDE